MKTALDTLDPDPKRQALLAKLARLLRAAGSLRRAA